jgi:hypothetical protein|tara:strand:+ start:625 stop:1491 length:867 start_codon:yes stop_codon:yes gene_type:complete
MADNLDPNIQDNQDPAVNVDPAPEPAIGTGAWKSGLESDLLSSPLAQKFKDDPEGLNNMVKSHIGLEKMMGHDKVPIPKGPDDVEGWNIFSKALGIPDKAEGYGLGDAKIPDTMKDMTFNKEQFAEIMHAHKLTPAQAKGLWETYQQQSIDAYGKALDTHKVDMNKIVNQMKGKWGDAYEGNIELGQMVINKFTGNKEMADHLTAVMAKDPVAIEFLAKVGEQFAENKIGEFGYKRFSLSPEQSQGEIDSILRDPKHPYNDPAAGEAEHNAAIDYVNSLYSTINRAKG